MRPILLAVSALSLATARLNPARHTAADPRAAIQRLRSALNSRDFEGGLAASDSLVRAFPTSPELGALRVALMAASGIGLSDETEDFGLTAEAQDAADSLARRFPKSPWSAYAKGIANLRRDYRLKDVLAWAKQALAMQPKTEDFVALEATAMCRMGLNKEAESFLNAEAAKGIASATLLALKANVIVAEADGRPSRSDTSAVTRGLAVFKHVRALDSMNVAGFALDGPCAKSPYTGSHAAEGYLLYKRAIELAPFGIAIHDQYWSAVLARGDRTPEEQRAEIEDDIDHLLTIGHDRPGILALASHGYDRLELPAKRNVVTDRLLAEFPSSVDAEEIWWQDLDATISDVDLNAVGVTAGIDAPTKSDSTSSWMRMVAQLGKMKQEYAAYIARPIHGSRAVLAQVELRTFTEDFSDSAIADAHAALRADPDIVDDWAVVLVTLLALHRDSNPTLDLGFARQIAYTADTLCRLRVTNTRDRYAFPPDYTSDLGGCSVARDDALGYIDLKEGNRAAADRELHAAFDERPHTMGGGQSRASLLVPVHLGELLEAENKVDDAETLYVMNGDIDQLERLYRGRHGGSVEGFDAYLTQRQREVHARRLEEIRSTRIAVPGQLPRFSLDRAGNGEPASLASLTGKIVIINFWGVWCGPCVMETPEIQKFYESIKSDTTVVFLTVDTRDTRKQLTAFMTERKFDYPVLFDNGWAAKVPEVGAYPSTLFVDRQGRVVYRQVGRSGALMEDFGLRLELLKASEPRGSKHQR